MTMRLHLLLTFMFLITATNCSLDADNNTTTLTAAQHLRKRRTLKINNGGPSDNTENHEHHEVQDESGKPIVSITNENDVSDPTIINLDFGDKFPSPEEGIDDFQANIELNAGNGNETYSEPTSNPDISLQEGVEENGEVDGEPFSRDDELFEFPPSSMPVRKPLLSHAGGENTDLQIGTTNANNGVNTLKHSGCSQSASYSSGSAKSSTSGSLSSQTSGQSGSVTSGSLSSSTSGSLSSSTSGSDNSYSSGSSRRHNRRLSSSSSKSSSKCSETLAVGGLKARDSDLFGNTSDGMRRRKMFISSLVTMLSFSTYMLFV